MRRESIVLLLAIVFVVAFLYFQTVFRTEYSVDGLKIVSNEQPKQALKKILSQPRIVIQENLFNQSSEENTAVGALGAELAAFLKFNGKETAVYGVVGNEGINCYASTNFCSNASIVIGIGECNCMQVSDKIELIGSKEFLLENRVKVKGILGLVLHELRQGGA